DNPLTERTDDYVAQTHVKTSYNREQFIDLMLERGTLMTRTDAVAVLNNIEETVAYIVRNGGSVNLPLFNTGFSITGVFNSPLDAFDPNRHHLNVTIHDGLRLRQARNEVKLQKVNAISPQPQIMEVRDNLSGTVDEMVTSGGPVEISGINIKIAGKDPSCGLYLVNSSGEETKFASIVQNNPGKLIAVAPFDLFGMTSYRVKIVTQYSGSNEWKEPRDTVYPRWLNPTYPPSQKQPNGADTPEAQD
ncbi:MAG: DUF4469 domain-containing protein, partial [Tannerellaceae bacterium]|nr:DUF4469 domain-containing protein [Tannerellaceae bacterium]